MWKVELTLRNSFSGNICFEFSVLCLCSAGLKNLTVLGHCPFIAADFSVSRRVSERVAALTFAHEIGHSLGATHDPPECEEDGEAGQYLMYRY